MPDLKNVPPSPRPRRLSQLKDAWKNKRSVTIVYLLLRASVILVLIAKVLPVFHQIYMELGSDLTGFAGAMMRFSDALNQYLFVIVIVLVAAAAGIFLISKSDAGQKFFKKRPLALSTAASRFAN